MKLVVAALASFVLLAGAFMVFVIVVIGLGLFAVISTEPPQRAARPRNDAPRRNAPAGRLSPELVGTWTHRAGGGETDFTGKSRYRSKRARVYEFKADGAFEYALERETLTIMQCEIKESRRASGRVSSDGTRLTIALDETKQSESNSCEGGETLEKTLPAETSTLEFRLQTDEATGARQLCLIEPDGEACFAKAE